MSVCLRVCIGCFPFKVISLAVTLFHVHAAQTHCTHDCAGRQRKDYRRDASGNQPTPIQSGAYREDENPECPPYWLTQVLPWIAPDRSSIEQCFHPLESAHERTRRMVLIWRRGLDVLPDGFGRIVLLRDDGF